MFRLFFLSFFFFACSGSPSVPGGVLPAEKMEAVLYDVIRSDEMVDFYALSDSTYRNFTRRTALYDTIFRLHALEKETFQKSMKFYQGRPDLLKPILDSLQQRVLADTVKKIVPTKKMMK